MRKRHTCNLGVHKPSMLLIIVGLCDFGLEEGPTDAVCTVGFVTEFKEGFRNRSLILLRSFV